MLTNKQIQSKSMRCFGGLIHLYMLLIGTLHAITLGLYWDPIGFIHVVLEDEMADGRVISTIEVDK